MSATTMTLSKALPLALLATAGIACAAPKFALIRVKDIYTALPSTAALQAELKKDRDEIIKNERAEQLRKIIAELQALQTQLADKTNPLDEATSKKLARAYEIKRQEAQTLQQEFESFKTEQEKAINKKMVASMRASLDRISAISGKISKERGFEAVFDSSGGTNTDLPFVLYSKDAPDLTADVQAALKDTEPPAPAQVPAPSKSPEPPKAGASR